MPTRVAINGFGRIGRSFVRSAYERGADLEIVAINDVADPATLAHLFTYDSVYGQFAPEVTCDGDVIAFDGREIRVLGERVPGDLPWADLGVDVVIEATGRLRTRADAEQHMRAGASKVILSAPSKGAEPVDANVVSA
jgi:glyceraldehyde 3-phosphate dehydrogenase